MRLSFCELSALQFELGFIPFKKFAPLIARIEQADPLLVIERDRKAAEAIHADSAFFADPKFQAAGAASSLLLFQFLKAWL